MSTIRVVIADDHVLAERGLRDMIKDHPDVEIVGVTRMIDTVLGLLKSCDPDVLVLDLAWPSDDSAGKKLIPLIRQECPRTRILAISAYKNLLEAAQRAGAKTLDKGFSSEQLLDAIRWTARDTAGPNSKSKLTLLSERERQVLAYIHLPNEEIAQKLVIAEGTVKTHVSNILSKLEVSNRTEAAVLADREGILKAGP